VVAATLSTFALIALAEVGDKSQLVCMVLAARHPALPVLAGAVLAFVLLNGLAVLFGAGIAAWVPEVVVAALVALVRAPLRAKLRLLGARAPAAIRSRLELKSLLRGRDSGRWHPVLEELPPVADQIVFER